MVVKEAPAREAPKRVEVRQVQIGEIFSAEFKALGTPPEQQEKTRKDYERYVSGLMNSVSVWLGFGEAVKADRQKLAEAVNKADERELFSFLAEVFRKDFRASFEKETLVATSIEDNKFNCYSLSALMADVLSRLGKEVGVIIFPNHVLLTGREFMFETTGGPTIAAIPNSLLPKLYPFNYSKGGTELLLAATYNWCGTKLFKSNQFNGAIEAYFNAMEVDPAASTHWNNTGFVLIHMGKFDRAISFLDVALKKCKTDPLIWNNKGTALASLGRFDEALKAYDAALMLDSKYVDAWENKGKTLSKMGREKEADECFNKALKIHMENE